MLCVSLTYSVFFKIVKPNFFISLYSSHLTYDAFVVWVVQLEPLSVLCVHELSVDEELRCEGNLHLVGAQADGGEVEGGSAAAATSERKNCTVLINKCV